jgi:CRP-like cAMP-binding protein
LGEARTATVVALDNCELYSLARADLDKLLEAWPEMAQEFDAMIKVRWQGCTTTAAKGRMSMLLGGCMH